VYAFLEKLLGKHNNQTYSMKHHRPSTFTVPPWGKKEFEAVFDHAQKIHDQTRREYFQKEKNSIGGKVLYFLAGIIVYFYDSSSASLFKDITIFKTSTFSVLF